MPNVMLYERVPEAWFDAFAEFLREHQPDDLELKLVQPQDEEPDSAFSLLPRPTCSWWASRASGARCRDTRSSRP